MTVFHEDGETRKIINDNDRKAKERSQFNAKMVTSPVVCMLCVCVVTLLTHRIPCRPRDSARVKDSVAFLIASGTKKQKKRGRVESQSVGISIKQGQF